MGFCCDIDGTLTDFETFVLVNGKNYLKRKYKIDIDDFNSHGYDLDEVFLNDLVSQYLNEKFGVSREQVLSEFWNYYYIKYIFTKTRDNAGKFFEEFKGNEKMLITTSRKKSTSPSIIGRFVKNSIIAQMKANRIPYDEIHFFETDEEKIQFIREVNPICLFDDKPLVIRDIASSGIPVICMDSSYNSNENLDAIRIKEYSDENLQLILNLKGDMYGKRIR